MSFKVPDLSYDYNALEPYIDEETMHFHHDKHHAAYVNMLNGAVEAAGNLEGKTVEELITDLDSVPADLCQQFFFVNSSPQFENIQQTLVFLSDTIDYLWCFLHF